ncbi:GAF domain-containing sensor histidine kinase [Aquimarina gracilis]|uniref:histidine kinase n=1 Tax=Aquimarina gracilis TaxID=874422 RepID=A0ABU6A1M8_9FLAO|nr:GAF domain-containing sensor histidine kinase [Aquimarina gracilis]MEB3348070.1 GAF domain-containing sensor histidine kinase [Aquimarina gracilis]
MISTAIPINEDFRLEALKSLDILDTKTEKEFDDITALANYICDTKVALISLVDKDRQWFKSTHGISDKICQTPRNNSLCSHAILNPETPLIIADTREDQRFNKDIICLENTQVVFYAGFPLVDKEGFALGTLCVMDDKPRELSEKQIESLNALARQVIILFELNKKNNDLEKMQSKLKKKNQALREFARVISHDLKMPLANIVTTTDLLKLLLDDKLDEESLEYFEYIKASSFSMSGYISDVLAHYESETLVNNKPEKFKLNELLQEIVDLLSIKPDFTIHFPEDDPTLNCNKSALKQIFFNLIGNSIKYNDKEQIVVTIDAFRDDKFDYFRITDNGMGIPNDKLDTIFELFTTADTVDRSGNKGNGIGLSTVKKLVEKLGGTIKVTSEEKKYTTFDFSIKKCC